MFPIEQHEPEKYLELEEHETLGLFEEGIIKRYKDKYEILENESYKDVRMHYVNFYKDDATYEAYLRFNRKLRIQVKIEYKCGIPVSLPLKDLLHYYDMRNAKLFQMQPEYRNVVKTNYLNELKILKQKYLIREN